MNISLTKLNTTGRVDFDINPDLSEYYKNNKDVEDIKNLRVVGTIIDNGTDDYEISLKITGDLILKSSVSGKSVAKKLNIEYNDFANGLVENYKNSSNSLDILPIIWENILLEIPIRIVSPEDKPPITSGDGWEIIE